jgi:RHS repeat-associated protein
MYCAYDANGNTLSDPSGKSFTWDFENRLISATVPGTGTVAFKYDPFGRRIQKSGPLGTTNYLYSGPNILEEVDNAGNALARFTRTKRIDETLATVVSGTTSYYERDGLGSVTSLSGPTGGIANSYTYDSFGKLTASTGTLTNPFQFTGRESDSETGLYYYRARYYDLSAGRFIGEDPAGFDDGSNFYDYAANDPIVFIDPWGLWHCVGDANCNFDPNMINGLNCFDNCTHCNTAITSGRRPPTPTHPNSSHSRGQACDAGRNNNPCLTPDTTRTCFLQCFPQGYCQEESNSGPGTHYHLQLNTVPGGRPGCAQGIQPYNP